MRLEGTQICLHSSDMCSERPLLLKCGNQYATGIYDPREDPAYSKYEKDVKPVAPHIVTWSAAQCPTSNDAHISRAVKASTSKGLLCKATPHRGRNKQSELLRTPGSYGTRKFCSYVSVSSTISLLGRLTNCSCRRREEMSVALLYDMSTARGTSMHERAGLLSHVFRNASHSQEGNTHLSLRRHLLTQSARSVCTTRAPW